MVDQNVFERRLTKLESLLANLRPLSKVEKSEFLADPKVQAMAERWLHLAVECALDLANHLIADCGWPSPGTYRETFQILERQGVLSPELSAQMQGWAGMRNVLVHLYLEIDQETIYETLTHELDQLEAFAKAIAHVAFGEEP